MALPQTFPMIYSAFLEGDFTVKHTSSSGSGVPLDQALDKKYNKYAKRSSVIIGYTRRKESVLKWNIIHRKKRHLTGLLYDICCANVKNEYSLHHGISDATIEADEIYVTRLVNYLSQVHLTPKNRKHKILRQEPNLMKKAFQLFLNVIPIGDSAYAEFMHSA